MNQQVSLNKASTFRKKKFDEKFSSQNGETRLGCQIIHDLHNEEATIKGEEQDNEVLC